MIFIVIPVFNRKEFTYKCLNSLFQQSFKDFKVILVDDGSTDGTSDMVTNEFPEVILLKGDGNLWWAGATNKGVEYVFKNRKFNDSDYILTLNNDLEVPENYLQGLIDCATKHMRAIVGSVSVDINNPEQMNFCGVNWNQYTGRYHLKAKDYNFSYKELMRKQTIVCSDMLPGRGTLINKLVFDEIGLFDSINFPQYASDEDFSLRANRKGWHLIIPTDVYVKSHITETGIDVSKVQFNINYFKQLFFSIKSPLNLKIRYRWAMKNTKLKLLYFLFESVKMLLSTSFKMVKQSFKNA